MCEIKFKFALLAVFAILIIPSGAEDPVFEFNGPVVIRQGEAYKFTATANGLKRPLKVDFKLFGYDDSGEYFEFNIINRRISNNEEIFDISTSNLTSGQYSLSANVSDPYTKKTKYFVQKLNYQKTLPELVIQTDKPIYLGGDVVKFRAFAYDSETRPQNLQNVVFTIYDSNSPGLNVISFDNVTFVKGKFEGSLQLSNSPRYGTWLIEADLGTSTSQKYFDVEDYVPPTYSVSLDVPSQVAILESTFPVTVSALYTFGEVVEGVAVVSFSQNYDGYLGNGNYGFISKDLYSKTLELNSTSQTFSVDIVKDLKITEAYQYVDVNVVFTETVTRKQVTASAVIYILEYTYYTSIDSPDYGLNDTIDVKATVAKVDGTFAPAGTPVTVSITSYCYDYQRCGSTSSSNEIRSYFLDSSGSVNIIIVNAVADSYSISASPNIAGAASGYGSLYLSDTYKFLKLRILTSNPTIGSVLNLQVITKTPSLEKCYCHWISKNRLLKSKTLIFVNQVANVSFTPDFTYAPTTQFVCFFHNSDGSIPLMKTSISFRNKLPNYLDLKLSADTVKPGTNMTLSVGSALNSTVSLSCLDQSVLLLKSGNDFSVDDIFTGLDNYNTVNYDYASAFTYDSTEYNFGLFNFFIQRWSVPYEPPTTTTTTTHAPTTSTTAFASETPDVPPTTFQSTFMPTLPPTSIPPTAILGEAPTTDFPQSPGAESPGPESPGSQSPGDPGSGSSTPPPSPPRIRTNFNETFLWQTVEITNKLQHGKRSDSFRGEAKVNFTAPDQITSYICSGVSMNNVYGMGLSVRNTTLRVFMPFFVQLNLPHHVKRGEVLQQDIIVFNYLNRTQNVTLSVLRNDIQFDVLEPAFNGWTVESDRYWQTLTSVANEPSGFQIVIKPKVLGYINIKVDAVGVLAGDSVSKQLRVDPEGIPKSITQSVLILKKDINSNFTASLACGMPSNAVNDTTSASAAVYGDIMGDVFNNLANLIQMSYGCGEQNMLNFVPDIVALKYLEDTGLITPGLESLARSYGLEGYIQELDYVRDDGSFSAFGQSDPLGSTWLTSYVAKSFLEATPYVSIDSNVIERAWDFVLSKQNPDGSFREDGRIIHKDMQGGSGNGLPMTAFIAIGIIQNNATLTDPKFEIAVNNSLKYIGANIDLTDVYQLAISTYVLYLGNNTNPNPDLERVANALWANRIETSDMIRWEKPVSDPIVETTWWYNSQPRSNDIEITSYALLYYLEVDLNIASKIVKYLVSQKNSFGGYGSSQDTVNAIISLAAYSAKFREIVGTINIELTPDVGNAFSAQVTPQNILSHQSFDLNPLARQLNVSSGVGSTGTAIASLSCNFYVLDNEDGPRFTITAQYIDPCNNKLLQLQIGLTYISGVDDYASNMVLVELRLPSGYVHDSDFNYDTSIIKRLDTLDSGTIDEIYIYQITNQTTYFTLQFSQTNVVTSLRPASIVVYDYYDQTKRGAIVFDTPENLGPCVYPTTTTTTTTAIPLTPTESPSPTPSTAPSTTTTISSTAGPSPPPPPPPPAP